MTAGGSAPHLPARARRAARRFAEIVCPPEMAAHHRTDRVLGELELMLAAVAPEARKALTFTLVVLDQAARLRPRSRGRRFSQLDDEAAEAYVRSVLASRSVPAEFVRRLKSLVVMCYYELPVVQREIGYHPAPYIAAVSKRRLESYGPEIRAGEAAVTAPEVMRAGEVAGAAGVVSAGDVAGARDEGARDEGAGDEGAGDEGAREGGSRR
ncbi:MAG TPA: hypothetical protein VME19_02185 [Streptosporangiaceae bacterium]|nr:hypothetical protein [Streptosporangiaceae bacterium]